jgi:hypothetical protein
MSMSNALGQPAVAAANVLVDQFTEWFATSDTDTIGASVELALGAGNISGDFYAEYTADLAHIKGISRVCLPFGSLHTNLAGVVMLDDQTAIRLTAALSGCFSIGIGAPAPGMMRVGWHPTGGTGASPNTIIIYTAGNDR